MSDRDTRKSLIIGAAAATAVAGAIAVSLYWRHNKNSKLENGALNENTPNRNTPNASTDENVSFIKKSFKNSANSASSAKAGAVEAAESYITALSRLLEEAGITDDREDNEKLTSVRKSEKSSNRITNINSSSSWANKQADTNSQRQYTDARTPRDGITELLAELNNDNDEDLLTNDSMAKVVLHLVRLKNIIDPDEKVDIRNIHFLNDGKKEYMVVEMFTSTYGAPAYDDELSRVWREVFPAQGFWNESFARVRVNVKEAGTENPIETVSCSLEDIKRYLNKELDEEQLESRCKHKRSKGRNNKVS